MSGLAQGFLKGLMATKSVSAGHGLTPPCMHTSPARTMPSTRVFFRSLSTPVNYMVSLFTCSFLFFRLPAGG